MTALTRTETILRRERSIAAAGLATICFWSWIYLLAGAGTGMDVWNMSTWDFSLPIGAETKRMPWDLHYWLVMLVMWWVMMIAMMVPSAAPMILLFGRVHRHAQKNNRMQGTVIPTAAFAGGYLLGWLGFSVVAASLQWAFELTGLLDSSMMWGTNEILPTMFLIAAGLYQVSPLKNVCLKHCRTPVDFLSRRWRKGDWGAARMGLEHGLYCVGCCWFLMALLFVGGVMNLVWIVGLAIFVLIEKLAPHGDRFGQLSGLFMLAGAGYVLLS